MPLWPIFLGGNAQKTRFDVVPIICKEGLSRGDKSMLQKPLQSCYKRLFKCNFVTGTMLQSYIGVTKIVTAKTVVNTDVFSFCYNVT